MSRSAVHHLHYRTLAAIWQCDQLSGLEVAPPLLARLNWS